jgi:protein phosphatase
MRFSIYQDSQTGARASNQDRMGYCYTSESLLLLLADGMGGHSQGEVAASLALQAMGALFQESAQPAIADPSRLLDDLIFAAHHELHRYRAVNRLPDAPRTTIVACLIQHGRAWWAHCGDSRLYWLRNGQILARTRDHSHVERLIAQGRLSPAARMTHPDRNKLYNCLGAPTLPRVDKAPPVTLKSGDQLLLCSDGLWGSLPEHRLAYQLCAGELAQAVPALVSAAVGAGGKTSDNVTALALTWQGEELDDEPKSLRTTSLPMGSLVTSIQAARHADLDGSEPQQVVNTSDIERAIAEMRGTLSKPESTSSKE